MDYKENEDLGRREIIFVSYQRMIEEMKRN
jgi:hypothetical protein